MAIIYSSIEVYKCSYRYKNNLSHTKTNLKTKNFNKIDFISKSCFFINLELEDKIQIRYT